MFAYDPVAAPAAMVERRMGDRRGMSIQFKPPVDRRVAARPV